MRWCISRRTSSSSMRSEVVLVVMPPAWRAAARAPQGVLLPVDPLAAERGLADRPRVRATRPARAHRTPADTLLSHVDPLGDPGRTRPRPPRTAQRRVDREVVPRRLRLRPRPASCSCPWPRWPTGRARPRWPRPSAAASGTSPPSPCRWRWSCSPGTSSRPPRRSRGSSSGSRSTPRRRAAPWRSWRCCRARSRWSTGASAWSSAACSPARSPAAPTCATDYRALGAAAYLGLGAVWALGLSSSAAQLQATPASLPPELLEITGVLDFGATIFTWQSLLMAAVLIALSVADRVGVGAAGRRDPHGRGHGRRPLRRRRAAGRSAPAPASGWSTPGSCRSSSACSPSAGWSSSSRPCRS